jgi:hypothetical protein
MALGMVLLGKDRDSKDRGSAFKYGFKDMRNDTVLSTQIPLHVPVVIAKTTSLSVDCESC